MKYTIHYEETLEVEATSFQEARDKAIPVLFEGRPTTPDVESLGRTIACITNENDEEEPT